MQTSTRWTLAYTVLAVVDTALAGSADPRAHRARRLTKPLLMPTLAASVVTRPGADRSPLRTTTLVAQAAATVGDVALLREGPRPLAVGSAAFAVGHGSYIVGFQRRRSPRPLPGPRPVAATWLLTAPRMAWAASRVSPALGPVVATYSATLAGTLAAATQLDPALPPAARRLSVAGAATFLASDALLGLRTFLLQDPPPRLESAVMATYTTAQWLLAEGAVRAGRPA